MRKIFLIDIDGVICEHVDNEHPELMLTAKPYLESIRKINQWHKEGQHICFFTARTEEHRKVTVDWLRDNDVEYDQIIFGKPRRNSGDEYHYIDDTPIRATTYKGNFSDLVRKTKEVLVFQEE